MKLSLMGLLCMVWLSCGRKEFATTDALVKYTLDESNGLVQKCDFAGYRVKVLYKPQDIFIHREIKNRGNVPDSAIDKLKADYNKNLYFSISFSSMEGTEISHSMVNTMTAYATINNRLSFGIGNYVFITPYGSDQDTIHVDNYVYNPGFGLSAGNSLLLVFKKAPLWAGPGKFIMHINDILEQEPPKEMVFSTQNIDNIPVLKY